MSSSSSSSGKWGKGCGSCHLTDANVSTDALAKDVVTQGTEAREKVEGYGKHCAECRQLDFLAVECSGCELWFCGAHGLSHQLSCADAASAASLRKGTSFDSARSRATDEEGNAARATKPKTTTAPAQAPPTAAQEHPLKAALQKLQDHALPLPARLNAPHNKSIRAALLRAAAR